MPASVHGRVYAGKAEMEDRRIGPREVEIIGRHHVMRARRMEERPLACRLHGHHVGIGRRGGVRAQHLANVDAPRLRKLKQKIPVRIVADEADRLDGKGRAQTHEIRGGVGAVAAAQPLLGLDHRDLLLLRPAIDHLVAVDTP